MYLTLLFLHCHTFFAVLLCHFVTFPSHLPLKSPTDPTRKDDNMPPIEKIETDKDQYMITAACCPASESTPFSVLFSDTAASLSDHTPKDRP